MAADPGPGHRSWLADAAQRAELKGMPADGKSAQRVMDLFSQWNAGAHEIVAGTSSQGRVDAWLELFRHSEDPLLFRFFAFRPREAIREFGPSLPERRRWSTLTEIYEATYTLASRNLGDSGRGMAYSWRLGAAHLARTRWVLLTQPFRFDKPGKLDLLRVNDEPGRLVTLAQQSREDWLAVLAVIDDYPQLAARLGDLETDAASLATDRITIPALGLDDGTSQRAAVRDDPVGREAARFAVTRLLLPRFAWVVPLRAYLCWAGKISLGFSAAACLAVVAVVVQFLIGFLIPWPPGYTSGAITAAAAYGLIAAAMAAEPGAAWPWLLRQPASAAVGLLALAAFGTTWWYTKGTPGGTGRAVVVMIGLAAAALLYLYVEASGHGVRGWRLLRRPAWVTVLGVMHGWLISLIGLRFLLPLFASSPPGGPALSCWYTTGGCSGKALPVPLLLGLAAVWSLAAGVFLQIIWDDQPVTATLAHVSWHRGG